MSTKLGAGGKQQEYDKESGRYERKDKLTDSINKYSSEPKRDIKNANIPQKKGDRASQVILTKQEWALWYKAVGENKKLGYWADETDSGEVFLKVETENTHKIVVTGGTFENPKAKAVYSFDSSDELNDAIAELKEL